MTTIAEIKRELQTYIAQAMEIENSNKLLKERVTSLEGQLRTTEEKLEEEKKSFTDKIKHAKDAWKEQAIEYGRKQREQAYEECDQTVKTFKELFLAESSNKTNSLVSSLVRSKFNEASNHSQSNIFGAIAHSTTSDDNLIICDFDITDNHIAIRNRSHADISISNYMIRFLHGGHSFKFPEGVVIHGISCMSLWWGQRHQFRGAQQAGSFVWPCDTHVTADIHEIAELVDRHGKVLFSVSTNQDTELMMNGSIPHVTASEKRNKRKRDEVASSLTSPLAKRISTSSNRHDNKSSSLSSAAVEVINLEDMPSNGQHTPVDDIIYNMNWESIFLMPTPKPSLHHRNAGPIGIISVEMVPKATSHARMTASGELTTWTPSKAISSSRYDLKDVHITVVNDSKDVMTLTGWRILVIGYPTSTFEVPPGTIIPPKRSILFTSNEHEAEEYGTSEATDHDEMSLSDEVSVGGTRHRRPREHGHGRPSMTTRHGSRARRETNSLITRSGALYDHTNSVDNVSTAGTGQDDHDRYAFLYGPATPDHPCQAVVIHELSNIAKYFPFPRSVHLLDATGQNVCEVVEAGDLAGVFTSSKIPMMPFPSSTSTSSTHNKGFGDGDATVNDDSNKRASCCIQ